MKTRKQIFRNFQYLECDAFAEYLERMAAKDGVLRGGNWE